MELWEQMTAPVTAERMRSDFAWMTGSDVDLMIAVHAVKHGVTVSDLKSRSRAQPLAHIRQKIMAKLRRDTDLSYPTIGRIFNRDHTTVLHAVRRIEELGA